MSEIWPVKLGRDVNFKGIYALRDVVEAVIQAVEHFHKEHDAVSPDRWDYCVVVTDEGITVDLNILIWKGHAEEIARKMHEIAGR